MKNHTYSRRMFTNKHLFTFFLLLCCPFLLYLPLKSDSTGDDTDKGFEVKLTERIKEPDKSSDLPCNAQKEYCVEFHSGNMKFKAACKSRGDSPHDGEDCLVQDANNRTIMKTSIGGASGIFVNNDGSIIVTQMSETGELRGLVFRDSTGNIIKDFNPCVSSEKICVIYNLLHDSETGMLVLNGKNTDIHQDVLFAIDKYAEIKWKMDLKRRAEARFTYGNTYILVTYFDKNSHGIEIYKTGTGELTNTIQCEQFCEVFDVTNDSEFILLRLYDISDGTYQSAYWDDELRLIKTGGLRNITQLWNFRLKDNPITEIQREFKSGFQVHDARIGKNGQFVVVEFVGFNITSPDKKIHKFEDRDEIRFFAVIDRKGRIMYKKEIGRCTGRSGEMSRRIEMHDDARIGVHFKDEEFLFNIHKR